MTHEQHPDRFPAPQCGAGPQCQNHRLPPSQLDTYAFQAKVAAKCTVFPDLNNAELQDSWGVTKPEELLGAMLIGGEFDDYVTEVFRINGFKAEQDLVDEAKN